MDKLDSWMSPLSGMVDAALRPIVKPIAQLADPITGDSETVYLSATNWREMSRDLDDFADELLQISNATRDYWMGDAGDAYRAKMVAVCEELSEIAKSFDGTSKQLDDAADQIKVAEECAITIITELIEMLLLTIATSLALSWLTAGISALAGSAAAAAETAVAGSRIAMLITRIAAALQKIAAFMKVIEAAKWSTGVLPKLVNIAVKTVAIKPIVSSVTGLTANPVGETFQTYVEGELSIGASKVDEALDGALPGPLQDVSDFIDDVDELVPKAPWQN